jgi:peptidylamidoglycolate lyase
MLIALRLLILLTCLLFHTAALAEEILGQGAFRYRLLPGWGVEALAQVKIKNGHAVALDALGRLFFLTDEPQNNVIILDAQTGALLSHWTARMPGAHGMTLLREGEREVLYITDTTLHEVRKLTLSGETLATFPWPAKTDLYSKAIEYRPSKTIHLPDGSFCVFDGYGKDYILHYEADGSLRRIWGGSLGEPENHLKHWGPHGGAYDDRTPSQSQILIAMSDQQEVRIFSPEGLHRRTIPFPGGNPRDAILFGEHTIIPHLGDQWPQVKDSPGFISIVDAQWRIISNIGAASAEYVEGVLQPMKSDGKTFIHPHGVTADASGNLYVAQFSSPSAPLLKLERVK